MVELVTEELSNGNKVTYQIVNGTAYHANTNKSVVDVLEIARQGKQRIRVFYGDTETGGDWMEEFGTMGTVGRSTGRIKIPLLIQKSTSMGGGGILDHDIVRIMSRGFDGKYEDVYRHPLYHLPELEIVPSSAGGYNWEVREKETKSKTHAAFVNKEQAERWVKFMKGESARK